MPGGAIATEYDAAVIGAGPAGSTVARLLASWGYSVVIISSPRRGPERAETLPPSSRRLFRLLDIHDDIDGAGFYSTAGNIAWWGSSEAHAEAYPRPDGPGYQVLRGEFDHLLLELAQRAGAVVVRDRVCAVDPGNSAIIRLRSGQLVRARFVIDGSGRAGVLARQGGLRVHESAYRTVAICGTWESAGHSSHTLIESYRDGWAWSVPVSADRVFVTVMIDTRARRAVRRDGLAALYSAELEKTRFIRRGSLIGPVWACDASLYHARAYAGPQFVLAGDAGSFIDPLSSYGVKKAMSSAWLAAVVVNTCLTRSELGSMAIDYFNTQERQVYADQMRQTAAHFRKASASEPFWTQRSQAPTDAIFYDEAELTNALEGLKRTRAIRLRRGPSVRPAVVPRISGRDVVPGEGFVAPGIPRAVEYMQGVHLWKLAEMAESYSQVPDLYAAYNRACPPVALPNFLSALSMLVAKNVLTNEGMA